MALGVIVIALGVVVDVIAYKGTNVVYIEYIYM